MDEQEVLREFEEAGALLRGHFILSSGLHSDTYLQCARVLMDPRRAEKLCQALAKKVQQTFRDTFDVIVSPAMGGVIVGYEMGRQLGVHALFCERIEKEFVLRRGFSVAPGTRVLVVEDVVTTGKSSKETFACVEQQGAKVIGEACLIQRNTAVDLGIPLVALTTICVKNYDEEHLPSYLKSIPAVKPGSRWLNTPSVA